MFVIEKTFVQKIFVVLFLLAATTLPMAYTHGQTSAAKTASTLPKLDIEEYRLKNGLRVVLQRDTSAPIVAVNVWYKVGSKNETAGKTGFAHLFEHMMFQGSKNYNDEYFKPLQNAGAALNGTTMNDRTNYYQVLPSNFLELALFMESDRMGGLLEAITQEKLDNQRAVVKNERRQRVDNQPYGTAMEKIYSLIYPPGHPYSWPVIGSLDDLTAASMDDIKSFFRKYYVPNNASLVIAGDFDPKEAKTWVAKYFGPIQKGKDIAVVSAPPAKLDGEVRRTFEDAVPRSRVYISWLTPPKYSEDDAVLKVIADLLSGGNGSRLVRNVAPSAGAMYTPSELGGLFLVISNAAGGKRPEDIEKAVGVQIERIKNEIVSAAELERVLNAMESRAIFSMERLADRADNLNGYLVSLGKADSIQADFDRYRKVTPADIQRVAKKYLNGDRLVVHIVSGRSAKTLDAEPAGTDNAATTPGKETERTEKKVDPTHRLPKPKPAAKVSLPAVDKRKLSNGLNVWIVRRNDLPVISTNLIINAGSALDPADRAGLAAYTAELIPKGSTTRPLAKMEDELSMLGTGIPAYATWDSSVFSIKSLARHFDAALNLYADSIVNPAFRETEIASQLRQSIFNINQQQSSPISIGDNAFTKIVYGRAHPYGRTMDSVSANAISRQDIENFYSTYYRPNNATLIVVGDVTGETLMPKLEKAFGGWKPGKIVSTEALEPPKFDKPGIYIIDKPGAPQSFIQMGHVGVPRNSPDYFALQVFSSILGGSPTSRLDMNLREGKGYTYSVRSGFNYRRGPGTFTVSASVQVSATKDAVLEFLKELNGIRGNAPVTQAELDFNKESLIRRYPSQFETSQQVSDRLAEIAQYGLPDSYINDYVTSLGRLTRSDVERVAKAYLHPDKMSIVIVGDRKTIEPKLKELNMPMFSLDSTGNPVQ